jgi:hypothetical protein
LDREHQLSRADSQNKEDTLQEIVQQTAAFKAQRGGAAQDVEE